MNVTLKISVLLGFILGGIGKTLLLAAAFVDLPAGVVYLGFALMFWSGIAFLESRLECHASRLLDREIAAYELGRLRSVSSSSN